MADKKASLIIILVIAIIAFSLSNVVVALTGGPINIIPNDDTNNSTNLTDLFSNHDNSASNTYSNSHSSDSSSSQSSSSYSTDSSQSDSTHTDTGSNDEYTPSDEHAGVDGNNSNE